jgi:hypothetical protein
MTRALSLLSLAVLMPAVAAPPDESVTVTGGPAEEMNVVCSTPGGAPAYLKLPDGSVIPTQTVKPSLLRPEGKPSAVFVLPKLQAGWKTTLVAAPAPEGRAPAAFKFVDTKGQHTDLLYGDKPVLRYFNAPHDPKDHYYTFKPFHIVFDPATGKTPLTTGSAKTAKDGLYPHHRGLFYGWNKVSYDGKTADVWHGTKNVFSQHEKVLAEEAGPVLGRQRSAITWHGEDGQTFANEERELTAYNVPGGTLIDFASVLKTDRKEVKLSGDPQHAGFHFRASQEVAGKDVAKQTYYLRPDGKGKPGETRNWDAKKPDPKTVNLPWDAASFVVGGKRYTVLRVNHPDNPKDARGSERDYARFGDYFEYTLTPEKPLKVKYRVWVQEGEMTVEQCNAIAAAYVHPPEVK